MSDQTVGIVLEGKDSASAAIREVGHALEETKGKAEEAGSAFERIKVGFESGMGFAAGITGFRELKDILENLGDATINFNGSLEQTTVRLDNLTGSAEATVETISRMKELSDASPFTFSELETANERLLRFNFSTERAGELVKIASDAAAGMGAGAAGVDTITEAFGRMNSRQELTTRGIMALIGMGVPAFDMLAKGLGITTAQAEDLTKKGLIPSVDAIKILSESLATKYPEMAAKIGGTFTSLKKTIADTMDFMFAELGKPVFDVLENAAKDWLAWLQSPTVKEAVTNFAAGLSDALKAMGEAFNALKGPVGDFANSVKVVAGGALQFVADLLATAGKDWAGWSAQAGDAGKVVDASLTGTSDIVQALQFLVQGNFTAAWKTAGNAISDFKSAIDPLRQVLEDNKTLIMSVAAAFGTFAVLTTVVPPILAVGAAIVEAVGAIGGLSIAVAEMGGPLTALALLVGGPVTLALGAVALATGALTMAWINNWGDIQGKTAVAIPAIRASLDEFGQDLKTTGTKAAGLRDDINAAFDPINANIDTAAKRWGVTLNAGWEQDKADAGPRLAAFGETVKTALNTIDSTMGSWQVSVHDKIMQAFTDDGIAAQIAKLGATIDAALLPITSKMGQWQIDIHNAIASALKLDNPYGSGVGGPGGIPNAIAGDAAALRPSQFSDTSLTAEEAKAACGPAALIAFMRASGGKVPTLREAMNMAEAPPIGLNPLNDRGMGGAANEQVLLSEYGLTSNLNLSPTDAQLQSGASSGAGEIISTLNHYFTATGFDAATQRYNVGTSGSDLVGAKNLPGSSGGTMLTKEEMTSLMGPINGLLTNILSVNAKTADAANNPTVTSGSVTSPQDLYHQLKTIQSKTGMDPAIMATIANTETGFDSGAFTMGIGTASPWGKGSSGGSFVNKDQQGGTQPSGFWSYKTAGEAADAFMTYIQHQDPQLAPLLGNAQAFFDPKGPISKSGYYYQGTSPKTATEYYSNWQKTAGQFGTPGGGYDPSSSAMGPAGMPGVDTSADATGTVPLSKAALAELDKKNKAASGEAGLAELAKYDATTTDWLEASQTKEQKKLAGLDTSAGRATTKVDTDLTDKLGADLTGNTSGDMFAKRAVDEDIKARKAALAERQQDETVANQIAVAADALRTKRASEDTALASSRKREDDNITHQQELAHEALIHSRTLQDTEIQYQQGLQLEATAHARTLEDAKIVANEKLALAATVHSRQLQDQQILANEQLALDQTAHQRKLQDQSIAAGDVLNATATTHSRTLQDAEVIWQDARTKDKEADTFAQNMGKATTDAQRASIKQAHEDNLKNIADQEAEAAVQLAHQRSLQDAEAVYQEGLRATALAKSRADADTEQKYKDGLADIALQTSRANADKEALYQKDLRAVALVQSRADADTETAYKETLAKTALDHSRSLQDTEIQYQIGIAHDALMRKRDEENIVRAEARAAEDVAIAHQIELAADARKFAKGQKAEQDALDKQLAQEAYDRQVVQLRDEAVIAKKNIADKLILDKQAAVEAAQAERDVKKTAFDEQAAAIIAKSKAAVEAAGGDFAPIEAKMTETVKVMDLAFATAHDTSAAALLDLGKQAADALGAGGKVPTAIGQTSAAIAAQLGEGSPAAQAVEVSDKAIEMFGQQFGLTWEVAKPLLGDIEQGIYKNLGENQLIPNHIKVSNDKVIEFAKQWGISWPEAAAILTTESDKIKKTFDVGGTVVTALEASKTAAENTNTAFQNIKDRTVTITTNYVSNGQAGGLTAGGNQGLDMTTGGSSGGGGGGGGGDPQSAGTAPAGSIAAGHAGSSGPGGIYNDPSTGHPYLHAAGGVTTGAVGGVFGEAGPEAIIPLAQFPDLLRATLDYKALAQSLTSAQAAAASASASTESRMTPDVIRELTRPFLQAQQDMNTDFMTLIRARGPESKSTDPAPTEALMKPDVIRELTRPFLQAQKDAITDLVTLIRARGPDAPASPATMQPAPPSGDTPLHALTGSSTFTMPAPAVVAPAAFIVDYDKLAAAMVTALNKNGTFTVGVEQMHSALVQKFRRTGNLGFS